MLSGKMEHKREMIAQAVRNARSPRQLAHVIERLMYFADEWKKHNNKNKDKENDGKGMDQKGE